MLHLLWWKQTKEFIDRKWFWTFQVFYLSAGGFAELNSFPILIMKREKKIIWKRNEKDLSKIDETLHGIYWEIFCKNDWPTSFSTATMKTISHGFYTLCCLSLVQLHILCGFYESMAFELLQLASCGDTSSSLSFFSVSPKQQKYFHLRTRNIKKKKPLCN